MSYYHAPSATFRSPGRLETKLSDGATLGPPETGWTAELAALCGFAPVVQTPRPEDTDDTTYDRSLAVVDGVPQVVWTARAKTADEINPPRSIEDRLAAVELEVRGIKDRTAATAVTNADAAKVRDAVAGKP